MFSEQAMRVSMARCSSTGEAWSGLLAMRMAKMGLSNWQFFSLSVPCFAAPSENDAP